ncbi:hypothetical protein [Acanthopleuribacter pedis]|uniref:Uncharacterized protein n=1 Tax=Acanthopleuribacter pedis TaxID=442870 RepID=A0A8J7QAJ7_9BACT|nr:hypothetical protein [Acanthopleuribacter pedis]MBO1320685.1 hypothetical protein [Acanthopleuribacter pedis]
MSPPTRAALYSETDRFRHQFNEHVTRRFDVAVDELTSQAQVYNLLSSTNSDVKKTPILLFVHTQTYNTSFFEELFSLKDTTDALKTPIIIWSDRLNRAEISALYRLGATSVIHQDAQTNSLAKTLSDMGEYWFRSVILPRPGFRG